MTVQTQHYVKDADLVTRTVVGGTIIVPVSSNVADLDSVVTLNDVASLIWERIDGRTKFDEIVNAICEAFDVSYEEAARDTVEFIGSLEKAGLIRRSEDAGS